VAFNVNPQMYHEHNGYIVSEQGKPPDFVMEVASPSTAENDTGVKRDEYAALGIPEYWRFDSTGADYGERLVGEVLDGDSYRSVDVSEIAPDVLQGYSPVLTSSSDGTKAIWNGCTPTRRRPYPAGTTTKPGSENWKRRTGASGNSSQTTTTSNHPATDDITPRS
jgi:hypothetical protein